MTSGSYTIGGTSPDYATVTAWEADITGNLTGIVEGKIRAGEVTGAFVLDANGFTVTASNYMRLTYDTGAYHAGDLRAGVEMRGAQPNTSDSHTILIEADYTRIVGLNFNRWHGVSAEAIRVDATECRIEHCLFWGTGNINTDGIFLGNGNHFTSTSTTDKLYVSNCFFGWLGRTSIHVQGDKAGTVYVYNCTVIGMDYGNQNCQDSLERSYVGMGDDLGDPPTTNGINWQIKNTFSHCEPDANGVAAPSFSKGAASSWTNCNNNASSDTTAPGTSAQTSVALSSQFEQGPTEITVGENSTDDYGGAWADTEIQAANPNNNYGSDALESLRGTASPINLLIRADLTNVPSTTRVLGAQLAIMKYGAENGNFTAGIKQLVRGWVEAQATYNVYSTGNSWTTAGATGSGDVDTYGAEGEAVGVNKRACGFEISPVTGGYEIVDGEWFALSGGKITEWMQDAIDGASAASDPDWLDLLFQFFGGDTAGDAVHCSESTDGSRPYWRIWYDTASAPLDIMPVATGVLDGNGANVGSDSDYPIGTTDLYGNTRDSTWDIGAVGIAPPQTATGTLVTQAGVGYDGVLSGAATLTGADVDQAGLGYDGVMQGADFLHPIYPIQGGWTGEATDIDEEPPVDADFIASVAAPSRVDLISNHGFEDALTAEDWGTSGAGVERVADGGAHGGSYVLEYDDPVGGGVRWAIWGTNIPLDPTKAYEVSAWARKPTGTQSSFYIAVPCYRADDSSVRVEEVNFIRGSLTYLTAPVSPSDTSAQVRSTAGFVDMNSSYLHFGALPDDSDLGDSIAVEDRPGLAASPIASGTQLNFATAAGVSYPAGTWVRQIRSGGTYPYPVSSQGLTTNWTQYRGRIGPGLRSPADCYFGETYGESDLFRPQTTQITLRFLMGYQSTDPTVTQIDDVTFERLDNVTYVPLKPTVDPLSSDRHHVRYRYAKDLALGTVNLKVRLLLRTNKYTPASIADRQAWNFTEIASWQHNDIGTTPTTVKQTLSGAQADAITYGTDKDLWLEFEATSG